MFTVVPSGTLLPPTVRVTGVSIAAAKVTSGVTIEAAGFAGIAVPAIERIRSTG